MTWVNRLKIGAAVATLAALPVLTNGCSSTTNPLGDICCTDFKPGADMAKVTFVGDAQVNGQFVAFAQASGDISAVASGAVSDVTGACQGIATDLGADPNDASTAGKSGSDLATAWCALAVAKINGALGAQGKASLKLEIEPPVCSASITAQANCQASCDVSGKCDIKANPPTCTGGTLEIDCKGGCTGSASAPSIDCTGSCSGQCSGSCQGSATVAVDCNGKCDGTCDAKAGVGTGTGAQADGTCQGTCKGTCTMSAGVNVKCSATCSGKCDAKCTATPGSASVKCGGTCDADYQPVQCSGGKLEGGCKVDAKCQGNCNASASAKAECTPPKVVIKAQADVNSQLGTLVASLEAHLPALLVVFQARGQAFLDLVTPIAEGGASITASGKLDVKGTACLTAAVASVTTAAKDFGAAFQASGSVMTSVQ